MRRRRTRRCSAVTALASRGASALQAWLWLLVFIFQNEFRISDSIQPGYLDFDNLPDTNFTCAGKVIGGYYADLETSCQMFHVCTVGQGDEPMDIKFLCLNGTVFDQETRVCERVDEVDCTKSEKFYSLNLELYGSTVPPPIEPEHDQSHDHNHDPPSSSAQPDPSPPALHDQPQSEHHTEHVEPVEDNNEPEEEPEEELEEDYEEYTPGPAPSTTSQPTTRPTPPTPPPPTSPPPTTAPPAPPTPPPSPSTSAALPTYAVPSDPTLLSPHEFTYQHARPAAPAPALSFQRQSYPQHAQPPRLTLTSHRAPAAPQPPPPPRPADHVYITAAPPPPPPARDPLHYSELEQIDHYELYESSKSAPRRPHDRPASFLSPHASRTPQGFRPAATATPPRSQLPSPGQYDPRPVQSYQPSERHEILYDERYRPQPPPPPAPTYDYNRYHFDRKRSHETEPTESSEARPPPLARSASSTSTAAAAVSSAGEAATERPTPKAPPKSPPRVIVTASASVSDSNGKKLNYTVGNVVSAVKPIVAINYDDYKESDLIFDPFFLDVPKLKRRRKTPAGPGHDLGKRSAVITLLQTPAAPLAAPPMHRQPASKLTTTPAWLPPDYVDDNYEPNAYVEAPPPQPPPETLPGRHESKKDKKQNELIKKAASKIVVSSQTPATSEAPTSARPADKRLGEIELDVWRVAARWPTALRPLLEALQRGGGEYRLVRAEQVPRRRAPGRFSCEDRRPYEVTVDARDCRTFHVCAGGANDALHVELQCALGLRYDLRARGCVPPARGQPACRAPLDNV